MRNRWIDLVLMVPALAALPGEILAQIAITHPTTLERQARAGEVYSGTIVVRNTTAQPQEAKVYQTDYEFFADGRTLFEEPGTVPRSNAAWITFAPSRLSLLPGENAEVSYTVSVPEDAGSGLVGSYWSVIMVEAVPRSAPESSAGTPGEKIRMGVRTLLRFAVQVVTHVATGERRAEFEGTRVVATSDGGRVLEFDVVNTGELGYRLAISLELYDAEGAPAGKFEQKRGLLYPGTSLRQRFSLGEISPGTYTALVVADTGTEDVFGAQYTLKF